MLNRIGLCVMCILALITLSAASLAAEDLSRNGNCEQVENGKPVGWDIYGSAKEWGSLEDGHEGKGAYFIPRDFAPREDDAHKGRMYTSGALCQGGGNGFTGPNALVHTPAAGNKYYRYSLPTAYTVSFWMKSECSSVRLFLRGWSTDAAADPSLPPSPGPTSGPTTRPPLPCRTMLRDTL